MSKIVVLDAGHGGRDPGAVNGKRTEANDVLQLTLAVKDLLTKQGITVHLTRDTDKYVELYSRPKFCDSKRADVFVSIHRNSHKTSSANGTEIWVHPFAPQTDTVLATEILERLAEVGIQSNRGIKIGQYVVLNQKAPAVMLELGFITNTEDNRLFDKYFDEYAEAIARGICNYLNVPYNQEQPKEYIRVQLGAFSLDNEAGARQLIADLRAQGIEAFLVFPSNERVKRA